MNLESWAFLSLLAVSVVLVSGCVQQGQQNGEIMNQTEAYSIYLPPMLSKDFYPNGLNRDVLLSRLPDATRKTGIIDKNETWEGVIRITGDLRIAGNATLTINPGTVILVSSEGDDQKSGVPAPKDMFNPKDPVRDEDYVKSRVEIINDGRLIARGTKEQPIIITSDSPDPESDDWMGISTTPGSWLEFDWVLIEYFRIFGISSSNVTISKSILRNMLETVVIMGQGEELQTLSPTITHSHLYNAGHHVITIRSGSPVITHNVIRSHPDMNLPGFELGAIGMDYPIGKIIINHNYIEGNQPLRFNAENSVGWQEWTTAEGAVLRGMEYYEFVNNTVMNCEKGLGAYPGPWIIENNNIFNNSVNLFLDDSRFEPADAWQRELFERGLIMQPEKTDPFPVRNNYWGTGDEAEIAGKFQGTHLARIDFKPFRIEFINEALPDWQEFDWQ
jgi:hypothetical protein